MEPHGQSPWLSAKAGKEILQLREFKELRKITLIYFFLYGNVPTRYENENKKTDFNN